MYGKIDPSPHELKINLYAVLIGFIASLTGYIFRSSVESLDEYLYGDDAIYTNVKGSSLPVFLIFLILILIPAIGGLIVGFGVLKFSSEAKGHGIPNVMKSMYVEDGKIRSRVPVAKFLLSTITIGSGGSAGSEGPIAQVGAGLGSYIGIKLNLNIREINILIATGAASAIGAVFNAPLGGVLFGLEVLLTSITLRSAIPVIVGTASAITTNTIILNNYESVFLVPIYSINHPIEYAFFIILGIIIGFVALLWQIIFRSTEAKFEDLNLRLYYKTGLAGLGVGIILYFTSRDLRGSSYSLIQKALLGYDFNSTAENELFGLIFTLVMFVILKIILTSLTLGSGSSGGVFSPSLLIGALSGAAFGVLLYILFPSLEINPGLYAILGMASLFGSVARAPLTMIIISTEMSGEYTLFPALMICVAMSYIIHNSLMDESIYTESLEKYGLSTRLQSTEDFLMYKPVVHAMHQNIVCIYEDTLISELPNVFLHYHHQGFPVVSRQHHIVGIITSRDFETAKINGIQEGNVANIMTKDVITTYPTDSIKNSIDLLFKRHIGRLPIVIFDRDSGKKIPIGIITRSDIIRVLESMHGTEYFKENIKNRKLKKRMIGTYFHIESPIEENIKNIVVQIEYDWIASFDNYERLKNRTII